MNMGMENKLPRNETVKAASGSRTVPPLPEDACNIRHLPVFDPP